MKTNKHSVYNTMYLPREVEDYRNEILANPPKVPAKIIDNWRNRIVPTNLYGLGEKGAYKYITKYGGKFSEKTLIHYALKAQIEKQPDMACGFWKRAYLKHSSALQSAEFRQMGQTAEPKNSEIVTSFQEMWFTLVREQRKYSCFSIFWALPSDKEAIRYLTDFGDDLKFISSQGTLVITLGSDQRLHVDVDSKRLSVELKGNLARVIHLFGIDFAKFPCLLVFRNMNSSEGIPVSIKGMTAEEISQTLRVIFSIIQDAAVKGKSPLEALQQHQQDEQLRYAGKAVVGAIQNFAKFTYKTIVETLTTHYAPK